MWPARFPGAASAIAVDPCGQLIGGGELDRVLRAVIRCQDLFVAALEFDELPRRTCQRRGGRRASLIRFDPAKQDGDVSWTSARDHGLRRVGGEDELVVQQDSRAND